MIHLLVGSYVKKPDSGVFSDWSRNNAYETLQSYWLSYLTSFPVKKLVWPQVAQARYMSSSMWTFAFNLICIEVDVLTLYLSFEIRETMNRILYFIASIPLKSLLLSSGSHIVSCFSAGLKFRFDYLRFFQLGLKILAPFRQTGLRFSARAESLSM